jgi:hypothetical protein
LPQREENDEREEQRTMEFNFNKSLTVDNLDAVPESYRGMYVAHEGKFKLDTEDPRVKGAVAAVLGLNTALASARAEIDAHRRNKVDLTPLAEYGETPEAIVTNFNARLTEAAKVKDAKDLIEKAVANAKKEYDAVHAVEKKKLEDRAQGLTDQLYARIVTSDATAALAEAKALAPEILLPHVASMVRVEDKDGQLVARVLDPATKEARFSGVTGQPMTIKELVAELKGNERYKTQFQSETPRGGGTPPRREPTRPAAREHELSPTEKIASGLNKGQHQAPVGGFAAR